MTSKYRQLWSPDMLAARNLASAGQAKRAAQMARDRLASDPDEAFAYFVLGYALYVDGAPGAIDAAQRYAALEPDADDAWWLCAVVMTRSGDPETAIAAAERAVRINPEEWRNHTALVRALSKITSSTNEQRAVAAAEMAMKLAPDQAEPHSALGGFYFNAHKWNLAQTAYEKALQLDPDNPSLHHNLAMVALNTGRDDQAVRLSLGVLKARPDMHEAARPLATVLSYMTNLIIKPSVIVILFSVVCYTPMMFVKLKDPDAYVNQTTSLLLSSYMMIVVLAQIIIWTSAPAGHRGRILRLLVNTKWTLLTLGIFIALPAVPPAFVLLWNSPSAGAVAVLCLLLSFPTAKLRNLTWANPALAWSDSTTPQRHLVLKLVVVSGAIVIGLGLVVSLVLGPLSPNAH